MEISEYKMNEEVVGLGSSGSRNLQTVRPFVITHSSPARHNTSLYDYESHEFASGLAEDTKSNKSVMTSKSTREVFDLLAKLLPLGILLLIVTLMVHFVTYVKDIEPLRSISEVACMALAATVIPLSVVFIMKTMCDWRRNSFWYSSYDCNYEDTLYIQPSPLHQDIATSLRSGGGSSGLDSRSAAASAFLQQQASALSTRLQTSSSLQDHQQLQLLLQQQQQLQQQIQLQQQKQQQKQHQQQSIQTITLNDEHTLKET